MIAVTRVPTVRVPVLMHTGVLVVVVALVDRLIGVVRHVLVRHFASLSERRPRSSGYPPRVLRGAIALLSTLPRLPPPACDTWCCCPPAP
ncbi:hypothetical protein GCM10009862_26130 [Microbacterium binotii]|uniref:Secreted protein n=1 Tax=Microbacterium binotii TaxID=462710 RepID=A0ABN3PHA2_9MICO